MESVLEGIQFSFPLFCIKAWKKLVLWRGCMLPEFGLCGGLEMLILLLNFSIFCKDIWFVLVLDQFWFLSYSRGILGSWRRWRSCEDIFSSYRIIMACQDYGGLALILLVKNWLRTSLVLLFVFNKFFDSNLCHMRGMILSWSLVFFLLWYWILWGCCRYDMFFCLL